MNILAIESSCDETAAAVVTDGRTIRSSAIDSQAKGLDADAVTAFDAASHRQAQYDLLANARVESRSSGR